MLKNNKHADTAKLWLKSSISELGQPLFAIAAGMLIGAIIILAMGESIFEIYGAMFQGGFGTSFYFLATLTRAIPIILCGLGAAFAWRAGYINIGGEGQLIFGGFVTAVSALYLPFRGVIGAVIAIALGMLAGGLYALLAAWLDDRFGVILVISTLMFNYIANYITYYFVSFPLKDNTGDGLVAKTLTIDKSMWIPRLGIVKGSTFHYGFFLAILVMVIILFIIKKTTFGYESRMGGLNKCFAEYGGVKRTKVMFITMFCSGAICAFGGSIEVLGLKHVYMHDMLRSPSYAWTGLMAALIANLNPIGTVICAIFLAGIQTGGAAIERSTNVPLEITMVIQAVITLLVSAKLLNHAIKVRKVKLTQSAEGGAQNEH